MAGIYIHIPFCRSRCIYCGFYSTTSLEMRQSYVDAVCREMEMRKDELGDKPLIGTLYLGGGTPSQLSIGQLGQLFDTLYKYYKVDGQAEVTIEVNPDDVTQAFAEGLKELPVNRVSMGAQTLSDERLKWLRRRHTAQQVKEAVVRLRKAGIGNISIDLMYGFPGEQPESWEADIDAALSLDVEHLSAYCLMVEENTALQRLMGGDDWRDEEAERQMYERLIDRLAAAGYEHYELSNFARPGRCSRHNSSYWNDTPYIGLGAAAHSYDRKTRSWNVSDLGQYVKGMEHGQRIFESEPIDADTHYNDLVTVALRTREGLDLGQLEERHRQYCMKNARRFISNGLLQLWRPNGHSGLSIHLALTRKGLFVSDMVMTELMMV